MSPSRRGPGRLPGGPARVASRWLRRGAARRRLLAGTSVMLLVAGGLLWAVASRGDATQRVALQDGTAWLVSSKVGQAALVDGASDQVVTQVRVAGGGADLTAAQADSDVYVADSAKGDVVRVDGATYAVSQPTSVARPGQHLTVFPGGADVFAFAEPSGLVTTADARTLRSRGSRALVSKLGPGGGVVDGTGRLWMLDASSGDLVWLDHDGTVGRRTAAVSPSGTRLVVAAGQAVVLTGAAVRPLGPDGTLGAATCLADGADDAAAAVAGSPDGERVYTASGRRGVLLVSDLVRHTCDGAVDLGAANHVLGTPAETAGRVFVPDATTGQVYVVDLARRTVTPVRVMPTGRPFQLVPGSGFMFYNDPASELAGVIRLDGTNEPIQKYDPARPDSSLAAGGAGAGAGTSTGGGPGASGGNAPATTAPATNAPAPAAPPGGSTAPTPSPGSAPAAPRIAPTPTTGPPPTGAIVIEQSAAGAATGEAVTLRVTVRDGGRLSSVLWAFGDGSTGSGAQVQHSWATPGNYTVTARVTLVDGRQAAPTAHVTVTAARPGTTPPSPATSERPGPSQQPDISHQPGQPGPTGGPVTNPTVTTQVPARGPTARLSLSSKPGAAAGALAVTADASGSGAGSKPITTYEFDFSGSFQAPQSDPTATHSYDSASGTVTVRVRVTDASGLTSVASSSVQAPDKATLTLQVTGPGKVTGPDGFSCTGGSCQKAFAIGDTVNLSATPNSSSVRFNGFSNNCPTGVSNASCLITLNGDATVLAEFQDLPQQDLPPQVTLSAGGHTSSTGGADTTVYAPAGQYISVEVNSSEPAGTDATVKSTGVDIRTNYTCVAPDGNRTAGGDQNSEGSAGGGGVSSYSVTVHVPASCPTAGQTLESASVSVRGQASNSADQESTTGWLTFGS